MSVPTVEGIVWTAASGGAIPDGALVGGNDGGSDVYVARATHEGAVVPGKLNQGHSTVYVPWGGEEHAKEEYEVLTVGAEAVSWVAVSGAAIPENAVQAGVSQEGEALYIGRVPHEGTITVGKVHPSHAVAYISFGGAEVPYPDYEILIKN